MVVFDIQDFNINVGPLGINLVPKRPILVKFKSLIKMKKVISNGSPSSRTQNSVASSLFLKTLILVLFLFFEILTKAFTQAPPIQWEKSLGGIGSDINFSIQQTTDGEYITIGYSNSNDNDVTGNHGENDYWVVKLDSIGNILWQKSLGGTGDDIAYFIQQTTDKGYIIAGESNSTDGDVTGNHGGYDYWIVKLDSIGNIQWEKSFGGTSDEEAYCVQQTTDGGYVVAGWSRSTDGDVTGNHGSYDYWIVKLNTIGNILWQKCLGGTAGELAYFTQQTTDGGYIIAGWTRSTDGDVIGNHAGGGEDYWIVKLDSSGTLKWQKCLGGTGDELTHSIQQTNDNGYIVGGWSPSDDGDVTGNHGLDDYWIVKLDSIGNIQWQKSLGGTNIDFGGYSIQQTNDNGYVVTGSSQSNDSDVTGNHGGKDYWVVKLDSIGNIQWQKSLGGTNSEGAHSVQETTDGGYIISGSSNSTDGDVTGNHGGYDYWIVKLGCHISTYFQLNSNITNSDILLPTDSSVVVQIDTIGNDIITTTDSIFVLHHLGVTTIITDSTAFVLNQCTGLDSVVYVDTVSNSVFVSDTVMRQTINTTLLVNVGLEKDLLSNVKVYPNPFTNEINIDVGNETAEITLFDVMGRMILQAKSTGHTIIRPNVLSGVYILEIISKNIHPMIKVVAK